MSELVHTDVTYVRVCAFRKSVQLCHIWRKRTLVLVIVETDRMCGSLLPVGAT